MERVHELERITDRGEVGQGIHEAIEWRVSSPGENQRHQRGDDPEPDELSFERSEGGGVLPHEERPCRDEQHHDPGVFARAGIAGHRGGIRRGFTHAAPVGAALGGVHAIAEHPGDGYAERL